MDDAIRLRVLLPYEVFLEDDTVTSMVAPTVIGAFGMLPHRQDCVVAIRPGLLSYETRANKDGVLAVDEGILVKAGLEVTVSVRNAIGNADLGKLREAVQQQFSALDDQERSLRVVVSRLETSLVQRSVDFARD